MCVFSKRVFHIRFRICFHMLSQCWAVPETIVSRIARFWSNVFSKVFIARTNNGFTFWVSHGGLKKSL